MRRIILTILTTVIACTGYGQGFYGLLGKHAATGPVWAWHVDMHTDHTQDGSTDVNDQIVSFDIVSSHLKTIGNGGSINHTVNSKGEIVPADFEIFADAARTIPLTWWIKSYDSITNGEIKGYANIGVNTHNADVPFYAAWGGLPTTYQGGNPFGSNTGLALLCGNGSAINASDYSPYAATATVGSDVTAVTGNVDGAFNFPDLNAAVNHNGVSFAHSSANNPTASITTACWIKTSLIPQNNTPIMHDGDAASCLHSNYELVLNTNSCRFEIADNAGSCWYTAPFNINLADGIWHYIVGTYDGANVNLYIDGAIVATTSASVTINNDNQPVVIGTLSSGANGYNGLIEDVIIRSDAMSKSEVTANYAAGKPGTNFVTYSSPY